MADYCAQCAKALGFEGERDLAGLCGEGETASVICEGCGFTYVDREGRCTGGCDGEWPTGEPHKEDA